MEHHSVEQLDVIFLAKKFSGQFSSKKAEVFETDLTFPFAHCVSQV